MTVTASDIDQFSVSQQRCHKITLGDPSTPQTRRCTTLLINCPLSKLTSVEYLGVRQSPGIPIHSAGLTHKRTKRVGHQAAKQNWSKIN